MESTRSKLIRLLADAKESYISGQQLSEQLHISRTAIWKHMKELEKDGYVIEAKPKTGYRIKEFSGNVSSNTITWGLNTLWIGKEIIHKPTVTSTQVVAHQAARDNSPHGTVVIADEQSSGRGRMERVWHSKKGKGVWMSIILRPNIPPYMAPQLTLMTATAIAEVLDQYDGIQPKIKWPNDILIQNKKVAGILTEMQAEQDRIQYVVVGIGLNVNQDNTEIPDAIHYRATSLKMETEKEWPIIELVQKILEGLEKEYESFLKKGFGDVKSKWENYGFRIGEMISLHSGTEKKEAVFLGIAEDGALLIESSKGEAEKIYSAEIDWFVED
ncbi:bifunctional protein BirA [Oceanobacillus picturae]|uniref:Bifunctional ligase/repressor BirA n=1 Tax=Oceanobacillus picturae TaxID=171693 RepID=A0A0U9H4A2_9BACI|nr:biotin--[acetyl-CoA-carboxylase] ligase [Oceanobacillus picturae]RIU96198.1 biotin--[acetyl-CoA-carboxylase] ligase [Oceanobacillus picturae]GAQ17426.1 bifunctional protein BirA [Oceanobacillus picturae]